MTRYRYNQQLVPPAPFVHVTLRCGDTGKELVDLPAQLDCAADRTVIPGKLVDQLGLVPLDELPVSGFGGQVFSCRHIAWSCASATWRRSSPRS